MTDTAVRDCRVEIEMEAEKKGLSALRIEAALKWLSQMVALARVQDNRRLVLSQGMMGTDSYRLIKLIFESTDEGLSGLIRSSALDPESGEHKLRFVKVHRSGAPDLVALETDWK